MNSFQQYVSALEEVAAATRQLIDTLYWNRLGMSGRQIRVVVPVIEALEQLEGFEVAGKTRAYLKALEDGALVLEDTERRMGQLTPEDLAGIRAAVRHVRELRGEEGSLLA